MILPALAGHRAARLTVLDCGTFSVRGGERIIGIPAFLIETDRGARLLVDGGFPPAYATDAAEAARADDLPRFGSLIAHGPHRDIAAQLALCGCGLNDLTAHILTHGHIDHVGALSRIACPLVLTATERADPHPRYFGTRRPLAWPAVPTLTVTDRTDLCQGVSLIPSPGHTPGHLSVLLDLPRSGPLLLTGDAINRASEPAEDYADAEDPKAARQSGDHLLALADDLGAMVIFGHDPAQWPLLRKAPAVYD